MKPSCVSRYHLDSAGNVTAEYEGATLKRTLEYDGTRLDLIRNPAGSVIARHFYDAAGNLDCITTDNGTRPTAPSRIPRAPPREPCWPTTATTTSSASSCSAATTDRRPRPSRPPTPTTS